MKSYKRRLAIVMILSTILSVFPVVQEHEHTAEAAVSTSCPQNGSPESIGEAGCSYCGGTGKKYYLNAPASVRSQNINYSLGVNYGYNVRETVNGNTKTISYYRCQNCGDTGYDCKAYTELVYEEIFNYDEAKKAWMFNRRVIGSAQRAQGYVPIRWCSVCGPTLASQGKPYETIATWAQYHIEEEITKTYTVTVVTNPSYGGSAGDGGIYKDGDSVNLWYKANPGYKFTSWKITNGSGVLSGNSLIVLDNVTVTANFSKGPTPTPEPGVTGTPTPKPTTIIKLPTQTPTPTPTPIPPRYSKSPQIVVPTAAPVPVPSLPEYSDEHVDICYEGEKHIHNNCSYPIYHSHGSGCYHSHIDSCYVRPCDLGSKTSEESGHEGTRVCNNLVKSSTGKWERCNTEYTVYYTYTNEICGCGENLGYRSSRFSGTCPSCGDEGHGLGGSNHHTCPNWTERVLNCGYYDDTPICGKDSSYIDSYSDCGKVEGYYYTSSGTKCDPVCDKVVIDLTPLYPIQTLQIGETPDVSAYATLVSSTGTHGDYPVKTVTCSMSGFNSSLYNTWQTVTLSYGTYSDSAKNAYPKQTTISVYIAGNLKVSFDANGGNCSTTEKTVIYGETYGTLPIPTRENYSFYGWTYNGAHITQDSIVATATEHTLTAAWTPLSQIVSFDANGGACSVINKTVIYGKAYGTLPTPTRTGYTFNGWWYGDKVITAASIVEGYGNHSLIAGWTPNIYKITLNSNGGICATKSIEVMYGMTYNNTLDIELSCVGHSFNGWWTSKDGGAKVYDKFGKWCEGDYWKDGRWSYAESPELYARWSANTYTVTLNGMGATTQTQTTTTITFNKLGSPIIKPQKTGYVFGGYYTETGGEGTQIFNSAGYGINTWTIPDNGEVYAKWIPIDYTVEIATDEIRVTPVTIMETWSGIQYGENIFVPGLKEGRVYHVRYNPNQPSSTPVSMTLTSANTQSTLEFKGWQLYRNKLSEYQFIGLYSAGTTIRNLTSIQGDILTFFPYWSGSASTVILPMAQCDGYNFIGWSTTQNETNPDNILYIIENETATYKPKQDNEQLYAQWSPKQYTVTLDDRGATTAGQGIVYMQFDKTGDKNGNGVTIPKKTGYTFGGYYTETRGNGTQYFDKDGKGTTPWKVANDTVLYAYWIRNVVDYPTQVTPTVTPIPTGSTHNKALSISCAPSVTISSSDYDVTKGIPSTEEVIVTATTGRYIFEGTITEVSGTGNILIHVSVPYSIIYEDATTEELKTAETGTKLYDIEVPRAYLYQILTNYKLYLPTSVSSSDTTNSLVFNEEITIPYTDIPGVHEIKSHASDRLTKEYELTHSAIVVQMTRAGVPTKEEIATELQKIAYVNAYNYACTSNKQFGVKSDKVVIDGYTILDDTEKAAISRTYNNIAYTSAITKNQTDLYTKSGTVRLKPLLKNGTKNVDFDFLYKTGTGLAKTISKYSNNFIVHTPVVVYPTAENFHQPEGVLGEITVNDYFEPLSLNITDLLIGQHNTYGYGDYSLSKTGYPMFKNIVMYCGTKLHFDVNGDTRARIPADNTTDLVVNTRDDLMFEPYEPILFRYEKSAGMWFIQQGDVSRIIQPNNLHPYVLASECTGSFKITYGVLAVNGYEQDYTVLYNGLENAATNAYYGENQNKLLSSYFAYQTIDYKVHYKFITFRWFDTEEENTHVSEDGSSVATKQGYEAYFYVTQIEDGGTVEVQPTYSLVDKQGNLIDDDILVLYTDYRVGLLGDMRQYFGIMPSDDTETREFRTNWFDWTKEGISNPPVGSKVSQTWTFNHITMNDASLATRQVYDVPMLAMHGAYRLPNGIRVLRKQNVPAAVPYSKQDFLNNWKVRDEVMRSTTPIAYETEGYLKVELDVRVIMEDDTVLVEYGVLPKISLYYTISDDTVTGLYYQHNGFVAVGDGMDDDVEVDHISR